MVQIKQRFPFGGGSKGRESEPSVQMPPWNPSLSGGEVPPSTSRQNLGKVGPPAWDVLTRVAPGEHEDIQGLGKGSTWPEAGPRQPAAHYPNFPFSPERGVDPDNRGGGGGGEGGGAGPRKWMLEEVGPHSE